MKAYERIVRDIADGVLLIAKDGTIVACNQAAMTLLGAEEDLIGQNYFHYFSEDREENLPFYQMLIDAVTGKSALHREEMTYFLPNGSQKVLEVTSSWAQAEDAEGAGVLLTVTDRTEEIHLRKMRRDSSILYNYILSIVCIWTIIVAAYNHFGRPFSSSLLSKALAYGCLLLILPAKAHTGFHWQDFGLNFRNLKRNLREGALIALICAGILCLAKVLLLKINPGFFPDNSPFFDARIYPPREYPLYLISVFCQELVAQGIVHEILRFLMQNKYKESSAILMSALVFASMHQHMGLFYVVGAALMLTVLGLFYKRQGNIWGLCIPHYVIGLLIGFLGFVGY